MYTHVRSALEIKRKQLEMNRKTAELKRAFYEFYLAKNGDSPDAMQTADSLWAVVEAALHVPVEKGDILEDSNRFYVGCFGALEKLNRLIPEPPRPE